MTRHRITSSPPWPKPCKPSERADHTRPAALSTLAHQQTTLLTTLPPRYSDVLLNLLGPAGIQRTVFRGKLLIQPKGFGGQPDNVGRKSPSHIKRQLAPPGPSEAMARVAVRSAPHPLCMRRGAQRPADQGSRLSERSAGRVRARPRWTRAPQVARSEAQGRRQWGRLFFVTFFWRSKESTAPPGAHPRLPPLAKACSKISKQARLRQAQPERMKGCDRGGKHRHSLPIS